MPCRLRRQLDGPPGVPAVVLVNSLGTDLSMWDAQVRPLAERLRVVRLDTRGHGGSPVPDGPYTLAELGGDVLALLDELQIERACLCGISLGGAIAMWVAANAPERVERLAVCFSSAYFGDPSGWLARAATVRAQGTGAIAEAVVGRWFTDAMRHERPDVIERMRAMIAATPAEGYAACCEAMSRVDLREALVHITAPTLVLSGSEDPATPPAHGRLIAAGIHDARFVELAGAAHLGNIERADEFNALLLDHLQPAAAQGLPPTQSEAKEMSG